MPRNDGRLVKDARSKLETAERTARLGGICEEHLMRDSEVHAAGDRLMDARAIEQRQLVHARLHAIRKRHLS